VLVGTPSLFHLGVIEMASERLKKLVLMLSSDHDGEIVAAARSIGRSLKDTGLDWHWLAAQLSGEMPEPHAETSSTIHEYGQMVKWLYENRIRQLRTREEEFISQLYFRFQEFGPDTFLSAKQRRWLEDIYKRGTGK
jgi:hypothetical protein